jgi:hypothetical protein
MGTETVTISISRQRHRELWELKDAPGDTYDEIIGDLLDHAEEATDD